MTVTTTESPTDMEFLLNAITVSLAAEAVSVKLEIEKISVIIEIKNKFIIQKSPF